MGFLKEAKEKISQAYNNALDATWRMTPDEKAWENEWKTKSPEQQETFMTEQIQRIRQQVFRSYLSALSDYRPVDIGSMEKEEFRNRFRVLRITRWVTEGNEKTLDRLKNVYGVLAQERHLPLALVIRRTVDDCQFYMALLDLEENKGDEDPSTRSDRCLMRLKAALEGNFPGSDISEEPEISDTDALFKGAGKTDKALSVALITNVASEKSDAFSSQGIEKLLDGFPVQEAGKEYTLLLLAEPMDTRQLEEQKEAWCKQYTALSPFSQWQRQFSFGQSVMLSKGLSAGVHAGVHAGVDTGGGSSAGMSNGLSFGFHFDGSASKMDGQQKTDGLTLQTIRYDVKLTLERLEKQIRRLEECEALGMWKFAAYVLSEDYNTAANVAHMYRALTLGENSNVEAAAVHVWDAYGEDKDNYCQPIYKSLQSFMHPTFYHTQDPSLPPVVDGATYISGVEIARAMNMPKSTVPGLPVLECAAFGRKVAYRDNAPHDKTVQLGKIYHMLKEETACTVLDKDSLTAHTFITGSTGAGKTNTVCRLLQEADVPFLVIEPAKGEYRHKFPDAVIYSTNPNQGQLLQLNPFWFPPKIHVLEHMDRLVEIFNACWPMYAAMPAVLKEAIEEAYRESGWDLTTSRNTADEKIYPSFRDVLKKIQEVMRRTAFSADSKGDYTGALVTRLRSLTNGINGQIFTSCGLSNKELFGRKVIVDLSRVGSVETKAMIMGLLVLQLQEYRMAENRGHDLGLRHLTVLEEAHHLLRRTSFEQASESANLQGKSVEMITNAIAEMRTYGEGFIIADQSPGLLDMAAIRNTNTKIILRLPELSDRELVGKAAGLNDEQIGELSRLETGVAAVYQNNWVQPVLCNVEYFKPSDETKAIQLDYVRKGPTAPGLIELLGNLPGATDLQRETIRRSTFSGELKRKLLSGEIKNVDNSLCAKVICEYLNLELEEIFGPETQDLQEAEGVQKPGFFRLAPHLVLYTLSQQELIYDYLWLEWNHRQIDRKNAKEGHVQ